LINIENLGVGEWHAECLMEGAWPEAGKFKLWREH